MMLGEIPLSESEESGNATDEDFATTGARLDDHGGL